MTVEPIYQCPICGLHYYTETTAKECEAWCRQHRSCNIGITKKAIENIENKSGGSKNRPEHR